MSRNGKKRRTSKSSKEREASLPDLTMMADFNQTEGDTTVPEVRHPIRSLCQATKNHLLV